MLLQERVLNHGVTDVASLINTKTLTTSKQKAKFQEVSGTLFTSAETSGPWQSRPGNSEHQQV